MIDTADMEMKVIIEKIAEAVVAAGSGTMAGRLDALEAAIKEESDEASLWAMRQMVHNAHCASDLTVPVCDDTGIPHLYIELGRSRALTGKMLEAIREGVAEGLRRLPGRPMAILGDDMERLDQSGVLSEDPGDVLPAPFLIRPVEGDEIRVHVLMFGGGPAIRGKTEAVFHHFDTEVIKEEIVRWATDAVHKLGCTPATLSIGIGRSQPEASALMVEAQINGCYREQTRFEQAITDAVNKSGVGALGIGGKTSVLATFVRIGPQRASGVRIVCLRPSCCVEPRKAVALL